VSLFTSGGLGLGLKNLVLLTSLSQATVCGMQTYGCDYRQQVSGSLHEPDRTKQETGHQESGSSRRSACMSSVPYIVLLNTRNVQFPSPITEMGMWLSNNDGCSKLRITVTFTSRIPTTRDVYLL